MKDMLESKEVLFDLATAFVDADLDQYSSDLESLKSQLADYKGRLGALKLENETSFILEFIGLASKMYSLLMIDRNGLEHTHKKAKGVPTRILTTQASHEHYRRVVFEPFVSNATFSALRSRNHVVEKIVLTKKMLTSFNDKVFQYEQLRSRPLGHWRNVQPTTEPRSEASAGSGSASSSGLGR